MKILVIAATGNLGKAIVNAALRDGHDVSVLVRDGTKVPWNGEQLTKVYVSASGSLGDQVSIALAGDTFDAVALAVGAQAADAVRTTISAVAEAKPSPVLLTTGGAPALILRPGNSCVDKCFGGAQWAKDLRDLHLGVTFAALQASTIPTWTMVCPGTWFKRPRARTASTARSRTSSTSPSWAPHSSTRPSPRRSSTSARSCCVRCGYTNHAKKSPVDAPQGQETRQEQVQQGPGRVQGRRRDVLLPALHDDARRLPLRLSIQLTPRRGRVRRPSCAPRETPPASPRSSDTPRR